MNITRNIPFGTVVLIKMKWGLLVEDLLNIIPASLVSTGTVVSEENILFVYWSIWSKSWLCCTCFWPIKRKWGNFVEDLLNIIPVILGSNRPNNLRGSDEKFTDDCHWWSCEPKKNYLFVQLWSSILPHFEKSLRIAINKILPTISCFSLCETISLWISESSIFSASVNINRRIFPNVKTITYFIIIEKK